MKLTKSKLKQIIKEEIAKVLSDLQEGRVQDILKKFRRPKATGGDKAMPKEKDEDWARRGLRKVYRQKALWRDMGKFLSTGNCAAIEERIEDLQTNPDHVLNQPEREEEREGELSTLKRNLRDCIKKHKGK